MNKRKLVKILNKNTTSAAITVMAVIISICIGAGRPLRRIRAEKEAVYHSGSSHYAFNIDDDLLRFKQLTANTQTVARRYIDASHPLYAEVSAQMDALDKALSANSGISYKSVCFEALADAYYALNSALGDYPLSDNDERLSRMNGDDVNSIIAIIKNQAALYNRGAEEFDHVTGVFPANVLRLVLFVKPLERFGDY